MPREQTIPCTDVEDLTSRLELMGYRVIDSAPDPRVPGFCRLRFDDATAHAAADGTHAMAAALHAPAPAPAPAPVVPAALDPLQKRTAQAIVNIFETGDVLGRYGQVTVINKDTGHLTFGRSQTTLGSGNLGRLIGDYCNAQGARFAAQLKEYLGRLRDRDATLDHDLKLHNLLRATADDPVMRKAQDDFFDRNYWELALKRADAMHIRSPLGIAVVYDSTVHGAWEDLRTQTIHEHGELDRLGEPDWIRAYIDTRANWLATNNQAVLHATVYRMAALKGLAGHDNWSLELPLVVRAKEISVATLLADPPDCYAGPAPGSRALAVTSPVARGADVRLVQLGLSDAGVNVTADGIFGMGSSQAVKQYQNANQLPATGIADLDLIDRLTS
jgi:chitosanase